MAPGPKLINDIVRIRIQRLKRHPLYIDSPKVKQALKREAAALVKDSDATVETLYKGRELIALFTLSKKPHQDIKTLQLICSIDFNPKDKKARIWIESIVRKHKHRYREPDFRVRLDAHHNSLLPVIRSAGLHIESLILLGRVDRALRGLKKRYDNLTMKIAGGIELRPAQSKHEINQILKIIKAEFTRNPQFGWFVTHPQFLKSVRKRFLDSLKKEPAENLRQERQGPGKLPL